MRPAEMMTALKRPIDLFIGYTFLKGSESANAWV